jgi:hypothetical protein
MFIALTEEMEDEDEVVTTKKITVGLAHIIWFQPSDDDPEKTFLEMRGVDSIVVAESYNEVWNRIREVTR